MKPGERYLSLREHTLFSLERVWGEPQMSWSHGVSDARLSEDGKTLWSLHDDGALLSWELSSLEATFHRRCEEGWIVPGCTHVLGSKHGPMFLFPRAESSEPTSMDPQDEEGFTQRYWWQCLQGLRFACLEQRDDGISDERARVLLLTGENRVLWELPYRGVAWAFSSDASLFVQAVRRQDGTIVFELHDTATGTCTELLAPNVFRNVHKIAFAQGKNWLLCIQNDGVFRAWSYSFPLQRWTGSAELPMLPRLMFGSEKSPVMALLENDSNPERLGLLVCRERFLEWRMVPGAHTVAALADDGALLVCGTGQPFRLHQLTQGTLGHEAGRSLARGLEVSPSGRYVLAVHDDAVRVWSMDRDESVGFCEETSDRLLDGAWAPDECSVLTISATKLYRWNWREGMLLDCWEIPDARWECVAVSPDGLFAALGGTAPSDGAVKESKVVALWDLQQQREEWRKTIEDTWGWNGSIALSFMEEGRSLFVATRLGLFRWHTIAGCVENAVVNLGYFRWTALWMQHGLVAAMEGNALVAYEVSGKRRMRFKASFPVGTHGSVQPKGDLVAVCSEQRVQLFDRSGTFVSQLELGTAGAIRTAWSCDGSHLVVATALGELLLLRAK